MPYRILIPDELPYSSGVENVAVAIVGNLLPQVESVTWMQQDMARATRLKDRLHNPPNLQFVPFAQGSTAPPSRKASLADTLKAGLKKLPLLRQGAEAAYRRLVDSRISAAAKKARATHCWFHFVQGQSVPELDMPVCGLVHDQNFRFFPENLPVGKPRQFQLALHQWLRRADLLCVLSEAGRREMMEIETHPQARIEIIPNAITPISSQPPGPTQHDRAPVFFYPAAALSHKNHLGLFKAAKQMAQASHAFKIVICGQDTDRLLGRKPMDNAGAEQARIFYDANRELLQRHVEALGHCSMETVEDHYRSCSAVVLPSLYEGFGLPLVEALSRNARVLCNRIIPFEEQVQRYGAADWVQWFDAADAADMARSMTTAPASTRNIQFPIEKLQAWTWKDVAARYMELFAELSPAGTEPARSA